MRIVKIGDEAVTVQAAPIVVINEAAALLEPLLAAPPDRVAEVLLDHLHDLLVALAILVGRPLAWLKASPLEGVLDLMATVLEVNAAHIERAGRLLAKPTGSEA